MIRDQSQIEYYLQITNAMPGRVLGKNYGLAEKSVVNTGSMDSKN
jgi:hypothetical protein